MTYAEHILKIVVGLLLAHVENRSQDWVEAGTASKASVV